jgi:hypothetical protein
MVARSREFLACFTLWFWFFLVGTGGVAHNQGGRENLQELTLLIVGWVHYVEYRVSIPAPIDPSIPGGILLARASSPWCKDLNFGSASAAA